MPASSLAAPAARRRPAVSHVTKRWLYIVHRWIGIVSCILFAMWFVSGLVMIYVPFPALGRAERLAGLPPLAVDQLRLQPAAAALIAGTPMPETITLEMSGDRLVWRVRPWDGPEKVVSAADGHPIGATTRAAAERIATRFGRATAVAIEPIERDQWTVAGAYNAHRPLWKVSLAGPGGRVLYVSSRTGAVVLDTDARERFWNWLGSVPHWLYPTVLRQDNALWRQVVMWVSGPCILGAVAGLWIGILRVRLGRRRFKGGRAFPYHGWMAWHHLAGLFGGLTLTAWIFSGWLSVDPFHLFASSRVLPEARVAYGGKDAVPLLDLAVLADRARGAKRVELYGAAGRPLLDVQSVGRSHLLDARSLAPATLGESEIVAAGRGLLPGVPLRAVERLTEPDFYWYQIGERPLLPMLRLKFTDPARTWVHIDPATGRLQDELDSRRRAYRWAFDLLHKWDVNALTSRRPLWDGLLWLLSILGLVTSVTGIWIGWKRLNRKSSRPPSRRR